MDTGNERKSQTEGFGKEECAATKKLTVIPAKKNSLTENTINSYHRQRVAAYARVSTDTEEQHGSYEAQCNYYENYIRQNPEWEFVKVYADVDTPYGQNPKSP